MNEFTVDPPLDRAVVGSPGTVTVAIGGGPSAGEVSVAVRGTFELFIAYADQPLNVGSAVIVYLSRGHRSVDVIVDPLGN